MCLFGGIGRRCVTSPSRREAMTVPTHNCVAHFTRQVFPDREHFGRIFYNIAQMSALGIPQISVVHGISVAGGAYLPAMSDATTIVAGPSGGHIFLAGPPLVRAATGEVVSDEDLGGGEMHAKVSGVTDYLARDDAEAIAIARGCVQDTGVVYPEERDRGPVDDPLYSANELHGIVGTDVRRPFDMRDVIARVVDGSRFREFKREYGETLVTVSVAIDDGV